MSVNFDPFKMVKISEQLDMVSSFGDNSNNIERIRRDIFQLSKRDDEMSVQQTNYMLELNSKEDLILSRTSMNDIDISSVVWDVGDYISEQSVVLDNQVVGFKDISKNFNLVRSRQKANLVLVRVQDMLTKTMIKADKNDRDSAPNLVIVPQTTNLEDIKLDLDVRDDKGLFDTSDIDEIFDASLSVVSDSDNFEDKSENNDEGLGTSVDNVFSAPEYLAVDNMASDDIFKTEEPFEAISMYSDRADDFNDEVVEESESLSVQEIAQIANKADDNLELQYSGEEMSFPEFWPTQEESDMKGHEILELSFDDQIKKLLSSDDSNVMPFEDMKSDVKTRKRVA